MITMIPHLNQQGLCLLQQGQYEAAARSFHTAAKTLHDHLARVDENPYFQAKLSMVEIDPSKRNDFSLYMRGQPSLLSFHDHNTLRFLPCAFALQPPSSSQQQGNGALLSVECLSSALLYNMALSRHLWGLQEKQEKQGPASLEIQEQHWIKAGRMYLMANEAAQRAWQRDQNDQSVQLLLYIHNNWAHASLQRMDMPQCQLCIQALQFYLAHQQPRRQHYKLQQHRGEIWMNTMLFTGRAPTAPAA
mmetsp:Transcript_25522/g.70495  ORF Transcript_25522/g.70495 Transcript_25522/m.70495 type:complete len:247 (+) Transcript_25522:111-851(+)